jgi:hypothetical protein
VLCSKFKNLRQKLNPLRLRNNYAYIIRYNQVIIPLKIMYLYYGLLDYIFYYLYHKTFESREFKIELTKTNRITNEFPLSISYNIIELTMNLEVDANSNNYNIFCRYV